MYLPPHLAVNFIVVNLGVYMRVLLSVAALLLCGCVAQPTKEAPPDAQQTGAASQTVPDQTGMGAQPSPAEPNSSVSEPKDLLQDKNSPEYFVDAGYALLNKRNTKDALKEFDKAITLCKSEYESGDTKVYAARSPNEVMLYMMLATTEGKNARAVAPTCADALYLKGYAVIDYGDLEQAQTLLERAVAMAPMNSRYLSELGHVFHAKRDWSSALKIFLQAEEAAQSYSPQVVKVQELSRAKRGVGFSLIELGRPDEAERKFRECLKVNPGDKGAIEELEYLKKMRKSGG